jgi:hypothetical protein
MKIEGSGSGSNSQRHGSADPDPDPHQNIMDPQHWGAQNAFFKKAVIEGSREDLEPEAFCSHPNPANMMRTYADPKPYHWGYLTSPLQNTSTTKKKLRYIITSK